MWLRVAGPPRERIILFDYDASHRGEVAARLLEGAHGTIQSDGYSAYDRFTAAIAPLANRFTR